MRNSELRIIYHSVKKIKYIKIKSKLDIATEMYLC